MNNSNRDIVELAAVEGHDADIPSNIGTIHEDLSKPLDNSPAPTEASITNFGKDIEKGGASREGSTFTTPDAKVEAQEIEDSNVVFWDGPDDLENPLNWPNSRKWAAIGMVSAVTFLTPLGSSIFAPGVPSVMEEFHSNSQILGGFVVSVYVLGFAFGPLSKSSLPLSKISLL